MDLRPNHTETRRSGIDIDLNWMRLGGLYRRQIQLFERLLELLLRQREAVVLVDVSLYQSVLLDQIHLLQELDQVRMETESQHRQIASLLGLEEEAGVSALMKAAGQVVARDLRPLQRRLQSLAEETVRLNRRNRELLESLGEIRSQQLEMMLRATREKDATYAPGMGLERPSALVYDVIG